MSYVTVQAITFTLNKPILLVHEVGLEDSTLQTEEQRVVRAATSLAVYF